MLEPALDYEGYLGIGDKAVTMEWDGVVPSRGRDGKSGSVTQVGGFKGHFKGHFYTSLCSTIASRGDCNGLLNMEVITVHLCVCSGEERAGSGRTLDLGYPTHAPCMCTLSFPGYSF